MTLLVGLNALGFDAIVYEARLCAKQKIVRQAKRQVQVNESSGSLFLEL
jgi:hypothetical protein